MNNKKTVIRFFTIADYEDEEIWLHNQHMNGWRLVKMIPPCFFIFDCKEHGEYGCKWVIGFYASYKIRKNAAQKDY